MKRNSLAALLASCIAATATAEVKETVDLVVTGGPNAGTHHAATERGGCSYGLSGPGSWGNQLSDPKEKDPKKFNSLQLIVPNAKAAAAFASGTMSWRLLNFFGSLSFGSESWLPHEPGPESP